MIPASGVGPRPVRARASKVIAIDSGSHQKRVLARRDAIVTEHLYLVQEIARHVMTGLPSCFDIEDLVGVGHFALIRAATRYRPKLHGGAPFSAYARQGIRGAMLDSIRRKNWKEATRPEISDDAPAPASVVEIDIDRERTAARVRDAVAYLPAMQQRVIHLCFVHDMRVVEIAGELGVTPDEVWRQRREAYGELKRILARQAA